MLMYPQEENELSECCIMIITPSPVCLEPTKVAAVAGPVIKAAQGARARAGAKRHTDNLPKTQSASTM